jgi:hypothetical protein
MNISPCARLSGMAVIGLVTGASLVAQQPPTVAHLQALPVRCRCVHRRSIRTAPSRSGSWRPRATEVNVNGTWDSGTNIKMTRDDAGVWAATVRPLAPQLWG